MPEARANPQGLGRGRGVPDDYEPPETTPQVGALRAYVDRREHVDHDTFAMGREFAELLLAEYDRLLYLAEVKYELLASERGYDIVSDLKPKIEKLYMALNAQARGDENDLDGDPAQPWNRLIEATATAMTHWLANARWAVLEHRKADAMRAVLAEAREFIDARGPVYDVDDLLARIDSAIEPPEKPEGAVALAQSDDSGAGS